jgi:amino-acid N-acetyltransferase
MSAELLDPTQLHWSQFWVIECNERQVACGQLRRYPGATELGSLVVATSWRTQGLGKCLAKHLIQQATKPLYLACGARLVPFYTHLGFVPIPWLALPCSLKLKFGFSKLATTLLLRHLVFMQYLSGVEQSRHSPLVKQF